MSQQQLAACAGIAQSYLWEIEAGRANPTVEVLAALSGCLGCDLGVRLFPNSRPRLHDRLQAPMVEALIRESGPPWRGHPEVPVPAARGVIDLVLRRDADRLTVVCECHSELRRLELVLRRLGEKSDAMAALQPTATLSRLLVLRSTDATREVARVYEATLRAAFPAVMRDALNAIRDGAAWPGPAILWMRVENGRAELLERPPRGVRVGR